MIHSANWVISCVLPIMFCTFFLQNQKRHLNRTHNFQPSEVLPILASEELPISYQKKMRTIPNIEIAPVVANSGFPPPDNQNWWPVQLPEESWRDKKWISFSEQLLPRDLLHFRVYTDWAHTLWFIYHRQVSQNAALHKEHNRTFTVYFTWNQLPYVSPLTFIFRYLAYWFFDQSMQLWGTHRPCTHAHRPEGQSKANQSDHLSSESPATSGNQHFTLRGFPAFLRIHSKRWVFHPKKMRKSTW